MNFGLFINSVISFTIVAFVLFMVVKAMNHLRRKQEEDPAAKQPLSREVELLQEIRDALVKGGAGAAPGKTPRPTRWAEQGFSVSSG